MSERFRLGDAPELLTSFRAARIVNTTIVARDPGLQFSDDELLDRCSFSIKEDCAGQSKTFYAERYGGEGISVHGGGARCGYDGEFQVKGIGPNPLAGLKADPFHSDGQLSLESALSEFLWSKVLQEILPYGAVSSLAVIGVKGRRTSEELIEDRSERNALLLREAALRPAHFERAIYFRPASNPADHQRADVMRVRLMIQRLPGLLVKPDEISASEWAGYSERDKFYFGMCELVKRVAIQFAYARSIFLMHNASASNMALDGRWLDLASVTSLHPSRACAEPSFETAWNNFHKQHIPLLKSVTAICFYANKFLFGEDGFASVVFTSVSHVFQQHYEVSQRKFMLAFAGIPMTFAENICGDSTVIAWTKELTSHLQRALQSSASNALFLKKQDDQCNFLHYSFARALKGNWVRKGNIGREIGASLHRKYMDIYQLAHQNAKADGVLKSSLDVAIAIGSVKHATEKQDMDFDSIRSRLNDISQADDFSSIAGLFSTYFSNFIDIALLRLRYDTGNKIELGKFNGQSHYFQISAGKVSCDHSEERIDFFRFIGGVAPQYREILSDFTV